MGIRKAVPGDLAACLQINTDGFTGDDPFDAAWLVAKVAEPGTTLFVDDAGVGVVRGFLLTQRYDLGTIVRIIAVGAQFRRQGVGSGLLGKVKHPAGAWVRKENKASRGMFGKAGWVEAVPHWEEATKPASHSGGWVFYTLPRKAG